MAEVNKGVGSSAPWYEHRAQSPVEEWAATTSIGPDLFVAAQHAASRGVELVSRSGLKPVDAYLLLSLVGELRVSEIVDALTWVASSHIPSRYLQL
jgi:acetamidase/formamidase